MVLAFLQLLFFYRMQQILFEFHFLACEKLMIIVLRSQELLEKLAFRALFVRVIELIDVLINPVVDHHVHVQH